MTRRLVEIDSLPALDAPLASTRRLTGCFVQSLDLTEHGAALLEHDPAGAVFLGCAFPPALEEQLRARGALIFPRLPDLPFDPYRPSLYDTDALYGTGSYAASLDAAVYAWSKADRQPSLDRTLAATLHDHAVTDALDDATDALDPRRVVGVMGRHALQRGEPGYTAAAELGGLLTRAGRTVLTGGGPGAMEAANLGAYLSPWPDALPTAVELLASRPSYRDDLDGWLAIAREVGRRWPSAEAGRSLSIPTWFYGHEPTNVFATGIAKYFANALREDTLLHRCRGSIVYLPAKRAPCRRSSRR